jgi:hypothetical protein
VRSRVGLTGDRNPAVPDEQFPNHVPKGKLWVDADIWQVCNGGIWADGNMLQGFGLDSLKCHGEPLDPRIVGLFVIVLACPKVVRLIRSYLRFRTVV